MSLINYGTGYWPPQTTNIPAQIYTRQQRAQIVNHGLKVHTEMAAAMSKAVAASDKVKGGCAYGDKYYMPKDGVGVL